MSAREDILFCKIAITSGLVKEVDAQKILSICEKRERETGRRPMIGAVFEKYNLLQKQDVQRVYQAIQKRTGQAAGAERVTQQARSRGVGSRKQAAPGKARGKVDQQTLVMGIGSIVVVLGILGFMILKLMEPKAGTEAVVVPAPGVVAGTTGAAAKPEPRGPVDAPKERIGEVHLIVSDQRALNTENPAAGLKKLLEEKTKLEQSGYNLPQQLIDAIKDFEELVKEAAASGGSVNPPTEEKIETRPDEASNKADEK